LILENARGLSEDRELCAVLSGAAYNVSYATFLLMGGKRGFLANPFLAFVRALSKSYLAQGDEAMEAYGLWRTYHDALGAQRDAAKFLLALHNLGLFVPLDHNPNEKSYYEAVARKARELGFERQRA